MTCDFIQLQKFRDELKNRSRVLKMLGHIDADGVLQLKGRAACLIDTGDELLITELMFNGIHSILYDFLCPVILCDCSWSIALIYSICLGTFNDLDHHQVASLASCFVPCDKSSEQIRLRNELSRPMMQLQEAARKIAEVHTCLKIYISLNLIDM